MMPTVREYLLGRLAAAGYQPGDVAFVSWDTGREFADFTTWVRTDGFLQAASEVDVREMPDDVRERIRFHMRSDAVFQWTGVDFERVDNAPRSVTVTAAMLRGSVG